MSKAREIYQIKMRRSGMEFWLDVSKKLFDDDANDERRIVRLSDADCDFRLARAEKALKRAGFKDLGGEEWKPPIGPKPMPAILRWDQRVNWASTEPASTLVVGAMKDEIAELRAAHGNTFTFCIEEEKMRHQAEEAECVAMWLDKHGAPFGDNDCKEFSLIGRVIHLPAVQQAHEALRLAMSICDSVPTKLHKFGENQSEIQLGKLVNRQDDGTHGYAAIRNALEAVAALAAPSQQPATPNHPQA